MDLTTMAKAVGGDVNAQVKLADWYYNGDGEFEKSYKDAAEWYEKAAKQGHAYAMYSLGYCYQYGKGVAQNHVSALNWYRMAAAKGNSAAMCSLGEYYEKGIVVNKNYDISADWYCKAVELKNGRACGKVGDVYYYYATPDYYKAAKMYDLGAQYGNAYCMYSLGYCYEKGNGVEKSLKNAVICYRKAAEKGNKSAKDALARLGY